MEVAPRSGESRESVRTMYGNARRGCNRDPLSSTARCLPDPGLSANENVIGVPPLTSAEGVAMVAISGAGTMSTWGLTRIEKDGETLDG